MSATLSPFLGAERHALVEDLMRAFDEVAASGVPQWWSLEAPPGWGRTRCDEVDAFSRQHRAALTGQQFQSEDHEPYNVLFEDFTHVKLFRRSLHDVVVLQHGATFDGFVHVDDWVPQRLVTATGPNPLPR